MKGSLGTRLLAVSVLFALTLWFVVSGAGSHSASAAVANAGFETGDLTGWTTGTVTEGVTVVGDDTIADGVVAEPLEGTKMARLGTPEPSDMETQPMGPNELYQNFTITENKLRFAYNIWTYDYTGFDEFRWEVRLTDTDSLIGSYQTEAWGKTGILPARARAGRSSKSTQPPFRGDQPSSSSVRAARMTTFTRPGST